MGSSIKIETKDGRLTGEISIHEFLKGYRPDGALKCPSCGKATMHFRTASQTKGALVTRKAHFGTNPHQQHADYCDVPILEKLDRQYLNLRKAVAQGHTLILNLNGEGLTRDHDDKKPLIRGKRRRNLGEAIGVQKLKDKHYLSISIKSAQDYFETISLIEAIEWDLNKEADLKVSHLGRFHSRDDVSFNHKRLDAVQLFIDNIMRRTRSSKPKKGSQAIPSEAVPFVLSLPFVQQDTYSLRNIFNIKSVDTRDQNHEQTVSEWHSPSIDVQHLGMPFYPYNERSGANTRKLPWDKIKFVMRTNDDALISALMAREKFRTSVHLMTTIDETALRAVIYGGLFSKREITSDTLAIEINIHDNAQIMLRTNHAQKKRDPALSL